MSRLHRSGAFAKRSAELVAEVEALRKATTQSGDAANASRTYFQGDVPFDVQYSAVPGPPFAIDSQADLSWARAQIWGQGGDLLGGGLEPGDLLLLLRFVPKIS